MKKNLLFLFSGLILLAANNLCAQEKSVSNSNLTETAPVVQENYDIMDAEIKRFLPKTQEEEGKIGVAENLLNFVKMYTHFNLKYPGKAIDEDFSDDIAEMFPQLSRQEVFDREENIRSVVQTFRAVDNILEKIIKQMMIPKEPPLIVDDKDYDTPYTAPYINSDKLVVILDIKKVISYERGKRTFEAIEAKLKREKEKNNPDSRKFGELKSMFSQLEFMKIPFYGIIYKDPFSGRLGLGDWVKDGRISTRIISDTTHVGNFGRIRAAINFVLPAGWYLNNSQDKKLKIDLSGSENVIKSEIFMPMPYRMIDGERDLSIYTNDFVIPVTIWAQDVSKPMELKFKLQGNFCNLTECKILNFEPSLVLQTGNARNTSMYNYIEQNYNLLPKKNRNELKVEEVVWDKPLNKGDAPILRVIFKSDSSIHDFEVFIDSPDDLVFGRPRLSINGQKVTARSTLLSGDHNAVGKKITITAATKRDQAIRQEHTIEKAPFFDIELNHLSLGLIMLAILGGFILNFMPCVFPVLSLKIFSLSGFGSGNDAQTRRSFSLTTIGIFVAFALLATLLMILKSLGIAIGWGMQFQNTSFLVLMIMVIVLFSAQIMGLINLNTPGWVNKLLAHKTRQEDMLNFLTGLFLVLLATPCSAPYLGTALGFALAGSNFDIAVIMTAVGLGLSLPYIILAVNPALSAFIPHPGPWMKYLQKLMVFMLILTVVWLVSILAAQTGTTSAIRTAGYATLILFILWFRKIILFTIDRQEESEDFKQILRQIFNWAFAGVAIIIIMVGLIDSRKAYQQKRQEVLSVKQTTVLQEKINQYLAEKRIVLISIEADWCLTCKFNDAIVLNNFAIKQAIKQYNVKVIEIDWTNYDAEVLEFMGKYGRKGLPFYIIYSPKFPNGIVLPEVLNERDLIEILRVNG